MREVEKRGRDTMRKKSGREIHVERERENAKKDEKKWGFKKLYIKTKN